MIGEFAPGRVDEPECFATDRGRASILPMNRARPPTEPLRRVFENAGILIFASLLVMSVALGRYSGALVWCGALLVFFAHAWEGRIAPPSAPGQGANDDAAPVRSQRFDALRWIGVVLAFSGAVALAL